MSKFSSGDARERHASTQKVLMTGSAGVIGGALRVALESEGAEVIGFDLRASGAERGDVRDEAALGRAAEGCTGILHLAAVSRVVWGERDPEGCWATNVSGTRNVIAAALARPEPPWLVFASSREVYGEPETLPVTEDTPLRPVNVYGRSKAEGEALVTDARERGLRAGILRFSNVYGSPSDHPDRVVPAFARAAAFGGRLRVDGGDSTFDFAHLDDTVRGITTLVRLLVSGADVPPPVHLATGVATTLSELAHLAVELAATTATLGEAPARDYDVSRFVGDPSRARAVLGWSPRVPLREGLSRLLADIRASHTSPTREGSAS